MAAEYNQVFFPESLSELFSEWGHFPNAAPFAGGTAISGGTAIRGGTSLFRTTQQHLVRGKYALPPIILSLDKINDLKKITRTERYLEIGAMVKLNEIILLGKILPAVLRSCLESIAGPQLRNIATIGGNICNTENRVNAGCPLVALDAKYELSSEQFSRWISASRFLSPISGNVLNQQELLTRIRIPLENWDYSVYRRFSCPVNSGSSAVFLMKHQKNILTEIRVIYKADSIIRDIDSESLLVGNQLPLSRKIAGDFIEKWNNFTLGINGIDEEARVKLINFIDLTMHNLSE